ncbi:hypothetical protein RQP46_010385 [Phenoliferia psychrophenolica]
MFYSTEILTSRKDGSFGIYWLAATLGSGARGGSSFKKISKKEVLACDLVKACEKLASPDEPLALRLSSNLLCGIARVYQQKYVIHLAEVTQVHQSLKKAFSDINSHFDVIPDIDLWAPMTTAAAATAAAPRQIAGLPGGGGINLPIDRSVELLGITGFWDDPPDERWGLDPAADVVWDNDDDPPVWDLGPDGAVQGIDTPIEHNSPHAPLQPQLPPNPNANQVRDLADITLHEPWIDDYKRLPDEFDDLDEVQHGPALPDDEPGLLEGYSAELDAVLEAASSGQSGGVGRGGGKNWAVAPPRAGGSSSAGGGAGGLFSNNHKQNDDEDPFNQDQNDDFDGGGHEEFFGFDQLAEEDRVARELRDGSEMRDQQGGDGDQRRDSSMQGNAMDVDHDDGSGKKRKSSSSSPSSIVAPPAKVPKSKKKPKKAQIDPVISITDADAKTMRDSYQDRMKAERAENDKAKREKKSKTVANDLVFGPSTWMLVNGKVPKDGGGIAGIFNKLVNPSLRKLGEGKDVQDRKRRKAAPASDDLDSQAGRSVDKGKGKGKAAAPAYNDDPFGNFDFNDNFGGGGGDEGKDEMGMGGHDDFIFDDPIADVEQGRAASGSNQRNSVLPWNVNPGTSDLGIGNVDFGGGGESSQGQGGTAGKLSGDTPLRAGAKVRSRTASLVPSALGPGLHRAGSIEPAEFGAAVNNEDVDGPKPTDPAAALASLEQESINFLAYAKRQAAEDPNTTLHFSDVVPVADSDASTAAQAFAHLLGLASKKHLKLSQDEPYGAIEIEFML